MKRHFLKRKARPPALHTIPSMCMPRGNSFDLDDREARSGGAIMLLQNVLTQGIRSALAAVAITACAVSVPALAAGAPAGQSDQQQTGQSGTQSPQTLSAVIVTGSHIPLAQLVTSQPVLKISHQEIENSGVKSVGEFLDNMTSVGFVQGAASGAFYANGTEQVDLRYLGSNRLLVLLNGKRMPSSFG
ncbi:MAG: TonB-dependent receptor plug domain-containing protein, partial [Gammaproteobacteria bacterium]